MNAVVVAREFLRSVRSFVIRLHSRTTLVRRIVLSLFSHNWGAAGAAVVVAEKLALFFIAAGAVHGTAVLFTATFAFAA